VKSSLREHLEAKERDAGFTELRLSDKNRGTR
jgi:hypothetical protein